MLLLPGDCREHSILSCMFLTVLCSLKKFNARSGILHGSYHELDGTFIEAHSVCVVQTTTDQFILDALYQGFRRPDVLISERCLFEIESINTGRNQQVFLEAEYLNRKVRVVPEAFSKNTDNDWIGSEGDYMTFFNSHYSWPAPHKVIRLALSSKEEKKSFLRKIGCIQSLSSILSLDSVQEDTHCQSLVPLRI